MNKEVEVVPSNQVDMAAAAKETMDTKAMHLQYPRRPTDSHTSTTPYQLRYPSSVTHQEGNFLFDDLDIFLGYHLSLRKGGGGGGGGGGPNNWKGETGE